MDLNAFFQTAPVHPDVIEQSLWMIIALPLLGAFVCGVFGRMMGRANVHLVACSAVAGAFVLSVLAFWATSHTGTAEGGRIPLHSFQDPFGLRNYF
ncbi:MAG TPA: NADH-quinone oxidoreductase subunit L, partial [Myxococcaceae bacterium]